MPNEYKSLRRAGLNDEKLGATSLNHFLYKANDAINVINSVVPAITKARITKEAGVVYLKIAIIPSANILPITPNDCDRATLWKAAITDVSTLITICRQKNATNTCIEITISLS